MNGLLVRLLPYSLAFFSSLCIMVLELVASRLVARHVGASLDVWTSVIGIMLGGICLGNVLGGRLADRYEARAVIGPLYAIGAMLTVGCLWINAFVGLTPGLAYLSWDLRTLVVVALDFLVAGTVLGMIGPVVAKIAVDQAQRSGGAIGNIYFLGAVGSIVGTFLAGFILMYQASTPAIVLLVGAALSLLAALLIGTRGGLVLGLLSAVLLVLGAWAPFGPRVAVMALQLNVLGVTGSGVVLSLGIHGLARLRAAKLPPEEIQPEQAFGSGMHDAAKEASRGTSLRDLALLSFLISMAFMAFEMVAGRMVTRHLGSSIYGWTSIIGVLLAGLSLGNLLGGWLADRIRRESQASWLFLAASVLVLSVMLFESPPRWLVSNPFAYLRGKDPEPLLGTTSSYLSEAISMTNAPIFGWKLDWGARVLFVVTAVFFLPSVALGTVSPVVAKLAIDRLRASKRTGTAIGAVYAWGMVGSILGTFLTGFVLIDVLGTKGVILALATVLALSATALGSIWHAAWAGIPLGLCMIAFVPLKWFEDQGIKWGIREDRGSLVEDDNGLAYADESDYYYIKITNEKQDDGTKRTLVLDNLIHGYFILGHPERLDYDYEHIYALITHRYAQAQAKAKGLKSHKDVPIKTMFLGGGAYTFPRHLKSVYPETSADVAEIDPAVTRANHIAMGLPTDTFVRTTLGDARQYVEKNRKVKKYDLIYGDAFNDFSVPWHLTTKEFNEKLAEMLTDDGIYMINIIDVYKSLDVARQEGEEEAERDAAKAGRAKATPEEIAAAVEKKTAEARAFGGFIGAWVKTAKLTFPHVYVFGTHEKPGTGRRETFVVAVSKKPIDVEELGSRDGDPEFFNNGQLNEPRAYGKNDMDALEVRSRGIVLTDDYAPVENLLAPIAATRGSD